MNNPKLKRFEENVVLSPRPLPNKPEIVSSYPIANPKPSRKKCRKKNKCRPKKIYPN